MELHQARRLPQHPDCTRCELHEEANSVGIATVHYPESLHHSKDTPVVFFIGQNPGFFEDQACEPFVGKSGQLVKSGYIEAMGLHERATIYLGNGVRCHTTANAAPKPVNYRECNQHLIQDLQLIASQPHKELIIFTLGAPATASFHKNIISGEKVLLTASFNKNGESCSPEEHKIERVGTLTMFSTYHPAAVLRSKQLILSVKDHLSLMIDYISGTMASPTTPSIVPCRAPGCGSPSTCKQGSQCLRKDS